MDGPRAERYVRLALQLDRRVEGIVDAYVGPPELADGPPAEPAAVVAEAERLLGELDDGWLRDQVLGLRTCAAALAGEPLAYADEAERCYGVRPVHVDESVFAAAHARLEALLPGAGSLAERHARWEQAQAVPADRVEPVLAAVVAAARAWTRRAFGLPDGEEVEIETVHGVPWLAFCTYLGGLRSRISVNGDLPKSALELLRLALHETYPGHHAERCWKERELVRGRGLLEETLVLVPSPQSLVSEGIATLAPRIVLESEDGPAFAGLLEREGVELDLAHALAVDRAAGPLRWAEVNAALMLHADGADPDDVRAYLERWALMGPDLSAHMIRFFGDPTSRTYPVTYAAGRDRCAAFVAGDPVRFRRLLTEQVRVRDLVAPAEGAAAADGP